MNALLLPNCPNATSITTFACTALGFLKSQKCFTKAVYALAPFGRWGNWGTEKLSDLPKLTASQRQKQGPYFPIPHPYFRTRDFYPFCSLLVESRREIFLVSNWKTHRNWRRKLNLDQNKITWFLSGHPHLHGKDNLFIALEVDLEEPNSTSDINCFIIPKTLRDCRREWNWNLYSRLGRCSTKQG